MPIAAPSAPLRVLIVHDYGTLHGGAEHTSVMLRDGLRRRGHDARFFASTAQPLPLVNAADYTCHGTTGPLRKVLQVANPSAVRRLRQVLDEFQPHVVHVRMFLTQLSPLILPLLRDRRALLHVVNYDLTCPITTKVLPTGAPCHERAGAPCRRHGCVPAWGLARFALQRSLRTRWDHVFDVVVANSHATRARLLDDHVRVDEVIWNGVPVRAARPPLASPPTISFVGRFFTQKGIDVLLHAMARVVRELPDARLLLAGDGPERPAVDSLAASLGLGERVTMLGHRPRAELEPLLASAWVQAVPSRWDEPFGLVAAEGMMRGTAVVATGTGGLAEQVRDGETGYTVPPADADALAAALLRILGDRALAERLGANGRAVALAEFSEERMLDRFVELYERLREGARPPTTAVPDAPTALAGGPS